LKLPDKTYEEARHRTVHFGDPERGFPCAHAHARAREKSLKNFRLVPLRRRYRTTASRARRYHADHADIGAGLVGAAWSSVMALSISEPRLA